jgi:hypothetical protein
MGLPVEVNNLLLGGARAYTIGRSLRFRSSASAYLNRTPSVAGNRKTWTWSAWVKFGNLSFSYAPLFSAGPAATNARLAINIESDNTLSLNMYGVAALARTTQVFRDPSAWYHIIVAVDTTQATASNRCRIYINGVEVTSFSTSPNFTLNADYPINNTVLHTVCKFSSDPYWFDGYLAELNFIDGQQLTPSSFGETDLNGIWQPKKYAGTYGTNGFYLPFSAGYNTSTTYAGSFNGSSQFLSVASSASLAPSTGDFTVEANVNFNALPSSSGYSPIFENQIATTSATSDKFYLALKNNAGTYRIEMGQHSTANVAYVNWTPTVGTWYHVALVRQSGTTLLFINGVQQTVTNSTIFNGTSFGQNGASFGAVSTPLYLNGYLSNARYVVGSAVYTTGFTPPSANLTAVTNTQWLTLQNSTIIDNSTAARTITNNGSLPVSLQYPFQYTLASVGSDYSGNSNNWTLNNINYTILGTTYDSMIDSPTVGPLASNYATWNPIFPFGNQTLTNGNLSVATGTTGGSIATISVSSGKWYWEVSPTTIAAGTPRVAGLVQAITAPTSLTSKSIYLQNDGKYSINGAAAVTYGAAITTSDIVGVALDVDAQTVTFYKNGSAMGSAISISSVYTAGNLVVPAIVQSGAANNAQDINFGQRPFSYTPPTGFNALNTYNLPAPSIANGAQYMAASLWSGDSATTRSIVNSGNNTIGTTFQPDFVWVKNRQGTFSHFLADSVRGIGKGLQTNSTSAESSNSVNGYVNGFNSDGFVLQRGSSAGGETNESGYSYTGWQWKAGGTGVTNNSGTITSTVSANPTAGFSIVTWTGNGSAGATVGHGLGVTPSMVFIKNRSSGTANWIGWHTSVSQAVQTSSVLTLNTFTNAIYLNLTLASQTYTFDAQINGNTNNLVAYCFAAVDGYSAFGKYTGNGSTDGPFIYTGFRPRFILIKNATAINNWGIIDTSRDTYNGAYQRQHPNLSSADNTGAGIVIDVLSNGFKCRNSDALENQSGQTMIYAAFAEHPFRQSRAR